MKKIFFPLQSVSQNTFYILLISESILAIVAWFVFGMSLIPSPIQVASAIGELFQTKEFMEGLIASIVLTLKGMGLSILISLFFSYAYFIPFLRPIGSFILTSRLLPISGLVFLFTLLTKDGGQLKLSLLIFGIVPFFTTSLVSHLKSIPSQEYDLCKTLRMNSWQTWYEVIIIGRLDQVIETMRQNFAIAWLMITMIEGLSMSEGGLGVLLIKANKYVNLPKVFALLVIVFSLGIFFDILLGKLRLWFFPYAKLQVME